TCDCHWSRHPNKHSRPSSALDSQFFYTACDSFSISPDSIVRIERSTLTPTVLIEDVPEFDASSVYNGIALQDLDSDGLADVMWIHGFNDKAYVCAPSTAAANSAFLNTFGSDADSEYGLSLDAAQGALYLYDESPDTLFRFQ
ncbi:MAG: hypothetical protein AAF449_13890, partial [Myxococcota bacterium]